ncbi:hypothetical protein ANCCAN_15044 [Ancylostoma caninum]|uniref:Uncharacterized protein n=1 Tax=Ancylostoma caninum TaxID=29170 RepID=A0A368G3M1_ANCCA|nr:hypothetical protein ANCCAN_15044 [Ancylostoma caninum]
MQYHHFRLNLYNKLRHSVRETRRSIRLLRKSAQTPPPPSTTPTPTPTPTTLTPTTQTPPAVSPLSEGLDKAEEAAQIRGRRGSGRQARLLEDGAEVQEKSSTPRTDKPKEEESFTIFEPIETPARPVVVVDEVKVMVCEGKPIITSVRGKTGHSSVSQGTDRTDRSDQASIRREKGETFRAEERKGGLSRRKALMNSIRERRNKLGPNWFEKNREKQEKSRDSFGKDREKQEKSRDSAGFFSRKSQGREKQEKSSDDAGFVGHKVRERQEKSRDDAGFFGHKVREKQEKSKDIADKVRERQEKSRDDAGFFGHKVREKQEKSRGHVLTSRKVRERQEKSRDSADKAREKQEKSRDSAGFFGHKVREKQENSRDIAEKVRDDEDMPGIHANKVREKKEKLRGSADRIVEKIRASTPEAQINEQQERIRAPELQVKKGSSRQGLEENEPAADAPPIPPRNDLEVKERDQVTNPN